MVAIPLIWSGPRRGGFLDRWAAWVDSGVAKRPERVRQSHWAPQRPEFLEHAAMSRELHRL